VRCVFLGTGGFLGRIDSETRVAFWADEPVDHDFDPSKLISIDLAASPNAAVAGEIAWEDVIVDDCFTGPGGRLGGTTLGPRWPEIQIAGAVFLEQKFYAGLPDHLRPEMPPKYMSGVAYEHMTALYWPTTNDPRAGRRYAGHHAKILEERGTLARVSVYAPGQSTQPTAAPFPMWIDLASPDQCDAGPDSLTAIGPGDRPKEGALFLISGKLEGAIPSP
jgi:hypothetical protein